MKLNNHGWGLRDMIIYTCLLLFFLFVACYFISTMYRDFGDVYYDDTSDEDLISDIDSPTEKEEEVFIDYGYYYEKELLFKSTLEDYLIDINYDVTNQIYNIRLKELVSLGYIDMVYDPITGTACDGYANVIGEATDYEISAYILCSNYISDGYYGG